MSLHYSLIQDPPNSSFRRLGVYIYRAYAFGLYRLVDANEEPERLKNEPWDWDLPVNYARMAISHYGS